MGLIKALLKMGHEVIAIAPTDQYTDRIKEVGCKFENLTMDSRGVNPIKDIALFFELRRLYKKTNPDIILHFTIKPNIYGTLAAHFLKIPVINNVSGLGTVFLWDTLATKFAVWMYKVAFTKANHVFFQNADDQTHFINRVGIKNMKSTVIPGSGVDVDRFSPNGIKPSGQFTFLVIARLLIDKGIKEYIEAIRILKEANIDANFQLLGAIDPKHKRGISKDQLQEWIDQGFVNYLGQSDDVSTYIAKANCIVLPSYREGTPRTLLEGGSMAKPLLASAVPGCKGVVLDGKNGFLFKVRDPKDLAANMKKMLRLTSNDRIEMGEMSRKHIVSQYNESIIVDHYIKVIKEVLPAFKPISLEREGRLENGPHQLSNTPLEAAQTVA